MSNSDNKSTNKATNNNNNDTSSTKTNSTNDKNNNSNNNKTNDNTNNGPSSSGLNNAKASIELLNSMIDLYIENNSNGADSNSPHHGRKDLDPSPCQLISNAFALKSTLSSTSNSTMQSETLSLSNSEESRSKKAAVLNVLAVKAASLIDWNLMKLEKELSIDILNELLVSFLILTLNESERSVNKHSDLEMRKLERHAQFALQLLHRWYLRVIVYVKFPKNLPGLLNPLQHMKEVNLKTTKVKILHDSVAVLEKFVKVVNSQDLLKPTSECFRNFNSDNGTYEIDWNKSTDISIDEVKTLICYDLGMFFFQQEDYEKSHDYFQLVRKHKNKITYDEKKANELEVYTNEVDSYITACQSILNLEIDLEDQVKNNANEQYAKQVITKMILIENCIKSNIKGMFEYSSLPISDHPMVLESIIAQQVEDGAEFVIDGRMAHLFSEMKDSEQLKFLSKKSVYSKSATEESFLVLVQNFKQKKHAVASSSSSTSCVSSSTKKCIEYLPDTTTTVKSKTKAIETTTASMSSASTCQHDKSSSLQTVKTVQNSVKKTGATAAKSSGVSGAVGDVASKQSDEYFNPASYLAAVGSGDENEESCGEIEDEDEAKSDLLLLMMDSNTPLKKSQRKREKRKLKRKQLQQEKQEKLKLEQEQSISKENEIRQIDRLVEEETLKTSIITESNSKNSSSSHQPIESKAGQKTTTTIESEKPPVKQENITPAKSSKSEKAQQQLQNSTNKQQSSSKKKKNKSKSGKTATSSNQQTASKSTSPKETEKRASVSSNANESEEDANNDSDDDDFENDMNLLSVAARNHLRLNTVKNMIGGKQQQTMTVAAKKRLADLDDLDVPSADELEDDEVEAKVVMVSKENEASVNQKNKLADLDDFDEPTLPLIPTPKKNNSNTVKKTTTNLNNNATANNTVSSSTKQQTTWKTAPKAVYKLAELDEFEWPSTPTPASANKTTSKKKTTTETNSSTPPPTSQQSDRKMVKQRMSIPMSKLSQVLGKEADHLCIIQDITGAELELEEAAIGAPERYVSICATTNESAEFALELLQALVLDPDVDLLHLLPSTAAVAAVASASSSINPSDRVTATKQPLSTPPSSKKSSPFEASSQQMPIKTKQSVSKPQTPVHNQPAPSSRVTTLNQFLLPKTSQELFGDSAATNESMQPVKAEPIKPRNFAEVVAKKLPPQNTSTLLSQSSNSSSVSSLNRMPIAKAPISKITNGVASPLRPNSVSPSRFQPQQQPSPSPPPALTQYPKITSTSDLFDQRGTLKVAPSNLFELATSTSSALPYPVISEAVNQQLQHHQQTIADLEEALKKRDLIEAELNHDAALVESVDVAESASTTSTNSSDSVASSSSSCSSSESSNTSMTSSSSDTSSASTHPDSEAVSAALKDFNNLFSITTTTIADEASDLLNRLSPFLANIPNAVTNDHKAAITSNAAADTSSSSYSDDPTTALVMAAVNSVVSNNKPIGFERKPTTTTTTTAITSSSTGFGSLSDAASCSNPAASIACNSKPIAFSDMLTDQMLNLDFFGADSYYKTSDPSNNFMSSTSTTVPTVPKVPTPPATSSTSTSGAFQQNNSTIGTTNKPSAVINPIVSQQQQQQQEMAKSTATTPSPAHTPNQQQGQQLPPGYLLPSSASKLPSGGAILHPHHPHHMTTTTAHIGAPPPNLPHPLTHHHMHHPHHHHQSTQMILGAAAAAAAAAAAQTAPPPPGIFPPPALLGPKQPQQPPWITAQKQQQQQSADFINSLLFNNHAAAAAHFLKQPTLAVPPPPNYIPQSVAGNAFMTAPPPQFQAPHPPIVINSFAINNPFQNPLSHYQMDLIDSLKNNPNLQNHVNMSPNLQHNQQRQQPYYF